VPKVRIQNIHHDAGMACSTNHPGHFEDTGAVDVSVALSPILRTPVRYIYAAQSYFQGDEAFFTACSILPLAAREETR